MNVVIHIGLDCIRYPVRSAYRLTVHIFGPTPLPTIKLWHYDTYQSLHTPLVQSDHFAIDGKRKILWYPAYAERTKKETPEWWTFSETIFEFKTFQLQGRSATQQTVMFGCRVSEQEGQE